MEGSTRPGLPVEQPPRSAPVKEQIRQDWSIMNDAVVAPGQLVKVRGEHWVVARVDESRQPVDELAAARLPGRTLVTLTNVSGDDVGDSLTVVWEMEPGRQLVSSEELPEVQDGRWDDPQRLGAFLDAARWGSVASADTETLQAPFRSGITVYPHQLAPVAKALSMPRVNLLVADDVGLGKTIEAGLVIQEMLLRHRARRVLVVCPASPGLDQVPWVSGLLVMPRSGRARSGWSRIARVVLAMLTAPRVLSRPMARLRKVAMARGAVLVWRVEASSA